MIYPFECVECGQRQDLHSEPLHPPPAPMCCGKVSMRVYGCYIDTSKCRDASYVPEHKRVVRSSVVDGKSINTDAEERKFSRHIADTRSELSGNQNGSFRHTHSVPADLFHGKIRETGDKAYWSDPNNVSRHKDCSVS